MRNEKHAAGLVVSFHGDDQLLNARDWYQRHWYRLMKRADHCFSVLLCQLISEEIEQRRI